jgi:hypothetical protein
MPDYEYQYAIADLLWRITLNTVLRKTVLPEVLADGGCLAGTESLFLAVKNSNMENVTSTLKYYFTFGLHAPS